LANAAFRLSRTTLIRVAYYQLLGVPLSKYRTAFPTVANGALSEIRVQDGQFSLLTFNFPLESTLAGRAAAREPDAPLAGANE
jgi:hypothetical protein